MGSLRVVQLSLPTIKSLLDIQGPVHTSNIAAAMRSLVKPLMVRAKWATTSLQRPSQLLEGLLWCGAVLGSVGPQTRIYRYNFCDWQSALLCGLLCSVGGKNQRQKKCSLVSHECHCLWDCSTLRLCQRDSCTRLHPFGPI